MNELDKILEGLIRRTNAGKLRWQRSVADNEFLASVGAISVVIRWRKGQLGIPGPHQLEILDDEGATAEVIETDNNAFWPVPSDRRATPEQAHQLDRLYVLARRSALNTQATLEKLAKALEAD